MVVKQKLYVNFFVNIKQLFEYICENYKRIVIKILYLLIN